MNGDNLSKDLIEAVGKITEKKTREQEKLQAFIRKELEKLGVNSPAELSAQKRKDLFNKVDKAFVSDGEEDGTDVEPEDKIDEAKTISTKDAVDLVNKFLEKGQIEKSAVSDFTKIQFDFSKGKKLNPKQKKMLAGLMKNVNTSGGFVLKEAHKNVFDVADAKALAKLKKGVKVKDKETGQTGKITKVGTGKTKGNFVIDFGKDGVGSRAHDEIIMEASDPETGLDTVEERFFRVEVVHGATGKGAVFVVAATNHRGAEQKALFAARDEKDLRNPPNIGGFQLVVDSSVEISEDEFENGEFQEPLGPKSGRTIPNE